MTRGLLGRNSPIQMRQKRREALREADLVILAGNGTEQRSTFVMGMVQRLMLLLISVQLGSYCHKIPKITIFNLQLRNLGKDYKRWHSMKTGYCGGSNYIPRRKSGIYWIQVRRAAAAAAVEISLWTR